MKKKMYEQPETKVVELLVTNQLLAVSTFTIPDRDDYNNGGNPLNP